MKLLRRWAEDFVLLQKIKTFEKRFSIRNVRTETQRSVYEKTLRDRLRIWEMIEMAVEEGEWSLRVYPNRLDHNGAYFINIGFVISDDIDGFKYISWKP